MPQCSSISHTTASNEFSGPATPPAGSPPLPRLVRGFFTAADRRQIVARSRNIKPSFFTNEELVELPYEIRLLFIGLWTLADREGRLEDRPKRVKMEVFPADDLDVDLGLDLLMTHGFIIRYRVKEEKEQNKYIQILNFGKHQHPHHKEVQSIIPEPGQTPDLTLKHEGQIPTKESVNPSDSLYLVTDSLQKNKGLLTLFDPFWLTYPKKRKKKTAMEIWKRKKLDAKADMIMADVTNRMKTDRRWLQGFIPDPTTYLNQERWDDEIEKPVKPRVNGNGKSESDWTGLGSQVGVKAKRGETMQAFIQRVQVAMGERSGRT